MKLGHIGTTPTGIATSADTAADAPSAKRLHDYGSQNLCHVMVLLTLRSDGISCYESLGGWANP